MKKLSRSFSLSLVAAGLLASGAVSAQSLAIINATLHTSSDQGVLESASIVMNDGKITAINPSDVKADKIIDAKGQIVTPGFIATVNQLGLVEVGAVAGSRDAGEEKAGIDFDASLAFNPRSSLIPYARKGGVTRDLITPYGGDSIFAGLASVVDLSGSFESVNKKQAALVVHLGERSKGSRAFTLQTLINKLDEHQTKASKEAKKDDAKPSAEDKIMAKVLKGDMPLLISVSRASDIVELIKVKQQFGVNIVLNGAQDAIVVKDRIAKAGIPVIISAMDNLPGSFDSLHASLNNAGILEKAGVKVLLTVGGDASHNVYQLRYDAGNAVSYGMSQQGALKAMTSNVADVFSINAGSLEVGKAADVVMWSNDPFELSSHVNKMFINGVEVSTESRQDKLRERYTTESNMPRAYTK
ncbi:MULTISPECIES: amidohydrolase family protein [Pseudoalteromonas]|jgi:imidazolonepropionase-like amidohydrolase|uniref:amidohydrolase family protein n=1 Tax=Pseudoalteromonas TaxID=53246 RepID=UPI000C3F59C4|nr:MULTISPECIES: amidohydrolase family protein [Pseudoalteromonas]MAY60467.1 amidohydrolase [Pseudoalteromonas sp.]MDN3407823.1 amidohydrolase family protein [Pseudoalteromonas sp. APC 3894]MDN3415463.1 amidohydrolase family protein [Pseudoalteromonas sp. APC 3227]MDN3419077.1 amidohydrolase family protein [Pseudoalteromonas sp. APC 3895]MDN3422530.1 amidohydrolase family protein [Pseudoalteromonas sp. APC 3896]|tara:strand:+ start:8900 stop:10141 length:1242 start_codon:yes stop_codon:yes gene_type:complete